MPKKKPQPAKTYHVAGPNKVLDHEPGETFEAVLDPLVEERLLASSNLAEGAASANDKTTGADAGEKEVI
jgi:hypothetical protein